MIGVDLGTTTVRIHVKGKGVVLREPAVIAVVRGTTDIKAVGEEAYRMLGRTPGNITAVRPMADGVIADYTLTEKMLKAFIRKVLTGPARFLRPTIMVCIPSGITEVEKRAVVQAVHEIGARKALLIEEPVAGAIGAGIDIAEPIGSMLVDIGGGTTDVAMISMGGIVVSTSMRVAGNVFEFGGEASKDADPFNDVPEAENSTIEPSAGRFKVHQDRGSISNIAVDGTESGDRFSIVIAERAFDLEKRQTVFGRVLKDR